jgi:hypothetical protein
VKPVHATVIAALLAALVACDQKPAVDRGGSEAAFTPTPDSSLTRLQVERWVRANQALDALSEAYQDSFSVEDPSERLRYQVRFKLGQDQVCTQQGLAGGYEEYRWILSALASPRNSALRDSFNIAFHR